MKNKLLIFSGSFIWETKEKIKKYLYLIYIMIRCIVPYWKDKESIKNFFKEIKFVYELSKLNLGFVKPVPQEQLDKWLNVCLDAFKMPFSNQENISNEGNNDFEIDASDLFIINK